MSGNNLVEDKNIHTVFVVLIFFFSIKLVTTEGLLFALFSNFGSNRLFHLLNYYLYLAALLLFVLRIRAGWFLLCTLLVYFVLQNGWQLFGFLLHHATFSLWLLSAILVYAGCLVLLLRKRMLETFNISRVYRTTSILAGIIIPIISRL